MPQIELSELAPEGVTSFSLANANLEVPCESTDPTVLANADAHPWLIVKYDESAPIAGVFADNQVKPEDDPLSAVNSIANDPDAILAANETREDLNPVRLAVDASLDQNEVVVVGVGEAQIAETLASDEDPNENKTGRTRRSGKEN